MSTKTKPSAKVAATVGEVSRKAQFQALLSSLPKGAHPKLAGREIQDVGNMFDVHKMSIHKFRHLYDALEPVRMQRDHLRRIEKNEVGYLLSLHLTHVNYMVVMHPTTGALGLNDGNARATLYFLDKSKLVLPSQVSVLVYYPETLEQYNDIYHCTDSVASSKKARHDVTSYYRNAGKNPETFLSPLVRNGALLSALRRLLRIRGYSTATNGTSKDLMAGLVKDIMPELEWLDSFELRANQLKSQGFYAALLTLKGHVKGTASHALDAFVMELTKVFKGELETAPEPLQDLFNKLSGLFPRGISGEGPVDMVYGLTFYAFRDYLAFLSTTATRAERSRLTTAAASLPALPEIFEAQIENARERLARVAR